MFSFFGRKSTVRRRPEAKLRVEQLEARELCAAMSDASSKTIRRVEKLHVLTASNLAPGNYSVSYHIHHAAVDHVLAHRR